MNTQESSDTKDRDQNRHRGKKMLRIRAGSPKPKWQRKGKEREGGRRAGREGVIFSSSP